MNTFSAVDEGNGVVKTYWASIRDRVAKVDPKFATIVDKIAPDQDYPVFLVYLPYGALKGDTRNSFLPNMDGSYYRLDPKEAPADILRYLGYGIHSSPFGMVLDKKLEYFIDLKSDNITLPCQIHGPGSVFPISRLFSEGPRKSFAPNGVLSVTAGARSCFMLPQIGCAMNHARLKSDFNIASSTPRGLYDHSSIFAEIMNCDSVQSKWRACLVYFSEEWLIKLKSDSAWLELKTYLLQKGWAQTEYERASALYYDIIFSTIQQDRNLKPNPYIADTARHIITTAIGQAPGYVPANDEDLLPLTEIQKVFVESYGLKRYHPTVMVPSYFRCFPDCEPVYYSLQYPSTHAFSPKSRTMSSVLFEMKELVHVLRIFSDELTRENSMCYGTILGEIPAHVEFSFYHNKADGKGGILNSSQLVCSEINFLTGKCDASVNSTPISSDGKFLRGCVKIAYKNNAEQKDSSELKFAI